jgi:hypothetical protein
MRIEVQMLAAFLTPGALRLWMKSTTIDGWLI